MRHENFLILAMITCSKIHAYMISQLHSAATFGHNFTVLFPSNDKHMESPEISITLMNPNDRRAIVKIEYAENFDNLSKNREVFVSVDPMNYQTVHFNDSIINICKNFNANADFANLVECQDSRIYITSSLMSIAVLANWYHSDAGDSFLVFPSSMATTKYAFSVPKSSDGITTIYFLPISDNTIINVTGRIGDNLFSKSFVPKKENRSLMAVQINDELSLIANGNASFTVIVAVHNLSITFDDTKTDFGAFMPTPLCDSKQFFDCYDAIDYHVSLLYDTKQFLVTHDSLNQSQFTVFDESENSKLYSLTNFYKEVKSDGYSQSIGFNSSSAMLQILKYGGYGNKLFDGSFLDLDMSWSQFVTGLTTFFLPSSENIVAIIGDSKATTSTLVGRKVPNEFIWIWVPLPFYQETFYYSTTSLSQGFYTVTSNGSYTIFVAGRNQNASYGYVTAYNSQISKPLPEIRTSVLPATTTEMPSPSTITTETTTVPPAMQTTTVQSTFAMETTAASPTIAMETTMAVISTTSEGTKESMRSLSNIIELLVSTTLFWLVYN
ncbi:Zonadhesin [Dirofilaria immitis]